MPAGVVIVLSNRMVTGSQIVVGADKLGRIQRACLQCRKHVTDLERHRYSTGATEDLTSQAGYAHLQTLQICQ